MLYKKLFVFVFILLFSFESRSQFSDTNLVNRKRVLLVSSSLALYFGGSFYYVQNSWWNEESNNFHFDPGNDMVYALNVDKAGHFLGGLYSSNIFSSAYQWAGLEQKKSVLYGAFFGTGIQLAIELKDAYAPCWGFSKWDFAIGTAGAFWPVFQEYNEPFKALNFKFSYFKRSNIYWDLEEQRGRSPSAYAWYDDYPNQTYWMTVNADKLFMHSKIPQWINIAFGFGLDDTQYLNSGGTKMGGQQEFYLALDYDTDYILRKWNTPIAKKLKFILKYYKLPAPTIKLSPNYKFYPFFM